PRSSIWSQVPSGVRAFQEAITSVAGTGSRCRGEVQVAYSHGAVRPVWGSVYSVVPAGRAITRAGRGPATARVPRAVPVRQSAWVVQARLSTRRPGARPPAGAAGAGRGAAAAEVAPPATVAATAAVNRILRDGCWAWLMGGRPPGVRVGAGPVHGRSDGVRPPVGTGVRPLWTQPRRSVQHPGLCRAGQYGSRPLTGPQGARTRPRGRRPRAPSCGRVRPRPTVLAS